MAPTPGFGIRCLRFTSGVAVTHGADARGFYADLKAYRREPTSRRRGELLARFDRIFQRTAGFVTLYCLLQRTHADKAELLMVLEHREVPLHTKG